MRLISEINPGESGCVDGRQCEAVWPEATCSSSGVCECPFATVPSRTRPVLCSSSSTETRTSNGGDGSTWCVYPDGDRDIFIADIYDCIAHPQIKSELFPEYHESVDGLCCPSRAFSCAQPMEAGEEPSVPRWWFNSATGTCTQFMWDPNTIEGASPNNFRTVEHCESYCRDTCARGAVEFAASSDSAIYDETPKSGCMSTRSTCGHDHECVLIGSSQTCCPTRENVCSPYGGRKYLSRPPANFDRGVSIAGSRSMTRYYYDVHRGKCLNFVYHGLGNFNNFNTKQDCEAFCSKLVCPTGTPLRIGEDWQRCETSADCPSSHSCSSSHHSLSVLNRSSPETAPRPYVVTGTTLLRDSARCSTTPGAKEMTITSSRSFYVSRVARG
ncbi:Kunitz/Bovine pancreatic trypsin inhibitor domain protein [Ancylostoma ceylanicum]|uniref:Kunitz/Bovine pancreatic trypsin inhibitor domain protein n=1 Tax=Ancylostoma ceylanicum TaxID=53326 RepID=A0A0D6LN96_9BILA|nr:Kunitz/Bovine pancreatic trypsin inhibitor domain protein [Ancylostoma ceylanicum]